MPIPQMEYNKITPQQETICAISTAPGISGIAVIRVSGPDAIKTVAKLWKGKSLQNAGSHTAHLGYITDPDTNETIDQCVATVYRAPATFTGEDIIELSVHGSQWIQQETLRLLINTRHCRLAEAGEFTRRAFANGKIDLSQAEAIADVIASTTRASHRLAMSQMKGQYSQQINSLRDSLLELACLLELELDFSEEDVEFASRQKLMDVATEIKQSVNQMADTFKMGKAIKEGIPVAIIGQPNTGKSTLLNALVGEERAIVSNIPGTTRDTIEDVTIINGIQYRFIDTAGLRDTTDTIEAIGIGRAMQTLSKAAIVIWLITPETTQQEIETTADKINSIIKPDTHLIVCINKTDLPYQTNQQKIPPQLPHTLLHISALTGTGLTELKNQLHNLYSTDSQIQPHLVVTNARHYQALSQAAESIARVINGLTANIPGDLIAQDVRQTIHHLGEITGAITSPDILATIFSRFCVGK